MSTRSERQAVYVSKRWRRLRRSVLASSRRRCAICGRAGRLEVDHLIPMFDGGETWAIANLQALCRGCPLCKDGSGEPPPTKGYTSGAVFGLG